MTDVDEFASLLLEESKGFLELADNSQDDESAHAFLHSSLLLCFCALEAHVNAIADDFDGREELSCHEQGILQEREVRLEHGQFILTKSLRIARLEDRIQLLYHRFSGQPIDRTAKWWVDLKSAMKLRNELTHPRNVASITQDSVENAITAVIESLVNLYQAVYRRSFPQAQLGLQSKLTLES